jgi:hypothetical protein
MTATRHPERPFAAHWFDIGLRIFTVGMLVSIGTIALGALPQIKLLGIATLACALLGAGVCLIGVRLYHPLRWRSLRGYLTSMSDSMRDATEAIGEPRRASYARALASADSGRPRVVWPRELA